MPDRSHVRLILNETAGALGDLGTFVPIVIGLVVFGGFDAATILVFAGLMNILAGLVFRIPIAVQPMKAIAVLAIAGELSSGQVLAAGIFVGLCMLILGGTGLTDRFDRLIPRPVIRSIQAAVGLKLLLKGATLGLLAHGEAVLRPWWGINGIALFVAAAALLVLLRRRIKLAVLGLIVVGFAAAAVAEPSLLSTLEVTLWRPAVARFDISAVSGVWLGGLAQLPLTLLNSVFAVSVLAIGLFPDNARRCRPARIAVSVGLMNLISCPFGGMPVCHGSGGLAAQHLAGARSGISMVILGAAKLAAGLLLGVAALAWMQAFPSSVLAVFLLFAGVALAKASRFWENGLCLTTVLVTAAVHNATGLLPVGFAAGWLWHALYPLMPAVKAPGTPADAQPTSDT